MAIDPRRRQKQLARKAAKRKTQRDKQRRKQGGGSLFDARTIGQLAGLPLYQSLMPERLFETGLGDVVISRMMGNRIAAGIFLVDIFCLGVKNSMFTILSHEEYRERIASFDVREELIPIEPACARKLIEGAVTYAQDLGFSPHKDYYKAKPIFGDIDPEVCTVSFRFGKDDKPFFVAGPYETPARSREIMNTLTRRCGSDGFHYMIGLGAGDIDLDDEEFEPEEE